MRPCLLVKCITKRASSFGSPWIPIHIEKFFTSLRWKKAKLKAADSSPVGNSRSRRANRPQPLVLGRWGRRPRSSPTSPCRLRCRTAGTRYPGSRRCSPLKPRRWLADKKPDFRGGITFPQEGLKCQRIRPSPVSGEGRILMKYTTL